MSIRTISVRGRSGGSLWEFLKAHFASGDDPRTRFCPSFPPGRSCFFRTFLSLEEGSRGQCQHISSPKAFKKESFSGADGLAMDPSSGEYSSSWRSRNSSSGISERRIGEAHSPKVLDCGNIPQRIQSKLGQNIWQLPRGIVLRQTVSCISSRSFSTALAPPGSNRNGTDASAITELALDSVVKIFTMASSPNYFLPWQNKPQREITGSGFVISGRRIVTNAHVVADQTYVVVRKHGSPTKYRAEVQAVGHECDLALLQIDNEEFWEGMRTLELGDIPFLQESVAVVGYPQGGDNISVTGGVVSRVEPTQYVHGTAHLMAIQIDAAINPGNSGGPALMEDKVVGVAFQNLAGAENIGYIIPVPIINHFLEDVEEKKRYVGFCSMGLTCQATENSQLQEHLKMPPGLTGVLINKIQPLADTNRWLRKDDVLIAFDGFQIANDGTVHFRNRERISFDHLVSMKKAGETGRVTILRNGDVMEFNVKLGPLCFLVPIHQFDRLPSYFIFAGLVFTPLTQPYLHEYGDDWYNTAPRRLCEKALTGILTKPEEQLVILSQVLMDEVNAGYERLADFQVLKVNGVDVHNLKHLKDLVEGCTTSSLRFDLDEGRVVVLNFGKAREASLKILQRHRIPGHASIDLLQETIDSADKDQKSKIIVSVEQDHKMEESLVLV